MVLVTGATGFVGKALLRRLLAEERQVGCLLRPSNQSRLFPPGTVYVATGTLQDQPALRVAMQNVHTVIHLVGARRRAGEYSAAWINEQGTANVVSAAQDGGVERIIFLSHMNADRSSAFPLLRSKGAAEEVIRRSGLKYTILRSSLIFGPDDSFTTVLAMIIKMMPVLFPVPGDGKTRFQPIHVDDMAGCLAGCLDADKLENVILPIGGPQHLSYNEILDAVMGAMKVHRARIHVRMPVLRTLASMTERLFPNPPISDEQLDLFSTNNTADLGNIPRNFNFEPRRFADNLSYLRRPGWRKAFLRQAYKRD